MGAFVVWACSPYEPVPTSSIDEVSADLNVSNTSPHPWLRGEVYFIEEKADPSVKRINLSSMQEKLIFSAKEDSFLYDLEVDPKGEHIYASYSFPSTSELGAYDRSGIVDVADSELKPLYCFERQGVRCDHIALYGQELSYTKVDPLVLRDHPFIESHIIGEKDASLTILSAAYPNFIHANNDDQDTRLAYIHYEPVSLSSKLMVGDNSYTLDAFDTATEPEELAVPLQWGNYIIVLVMRPLQRNFITALSDWFQGTLHAHGNHNVPGDWWSVNLEDGKTQQLTFLNTIHYDGCILEGANILVVSALDGLWAVDLETHGTIKLKHSREIRSVSCRDLGPPIDVSMDTSQSIGSREN